MERRFFLGLWLLVALLVLGFLNAGWVDRANAQVVRALEQTEEAIQAGDLDRAEALAQQARKLWQDGWNTVAAVADHTAMDEINGLFAEMEHYARSRAHTLFGASCARVRELVEAVSDDHRFTWWNFL